MSELKAYAVALKTDKGTQVMTPCQAVYLKSEADKVIAELKKACNDKDDWCLHTLKENRHHKYKRCLAMARWCCDAYDKWMTRKAKAIGLGMDGVKEYHRARRKLFHYMRWQKRWLELAEKFKEAK